MYNDSLRLQEDPFLKSYLSADLNTFFFFFQVPRELGELGGNLRTVLLLNTYADVWVRVSVTWPRARLAHRHPERLHDNA